MISITIITIIVVAVIIIIIIIIIITIIAVIVALIITGNSPSEDSKEKEEPSAKSITAPTPRIDESSQKERRKLQATATPSRLPSTFQGMEVTPVLQNRKIPKDVLLTGRL